jgi:hypothetical protein
VVAVQVDVFPFQLELYGHANPIAVSPVARDKVTVGWGERDSPAAVRRRNSLAALIAIACKIGPHLFNDLLLPSGNSSRWYWSVNFFWFDKVVADALVHNFRWFRFVLRVNSGHMQRQP